MISLRTTLATLAGLTLLLPALARADYRMTEESWFEGGMAAMMGGMKTSKTLAITKNTWREETINHYGKERLVTVRIADCDGKKSIKTDPNLKLMVTGVDPKEQSTPFGMGGSRPSGGDNKKPKGKGKMVMTYTVKDLGVEDFALAGYVPNPVQARHFEIKMRMQMTGCGTMDNTFTQEQWIANIEKPGDVCRWTESGDAAAMARAYQPDCEMTMEQAGDVAEYKRVQELAARGMVVRERTTMTMPGGAGGKMTMNRKVTLYTQAPQEAALFEAPADFRTVNNQEFSQAQQKAQMQAMQKMMMNMRNQPREEDEAGAAPEEAPAEEAMAEEAPAEAGGGEGGGDEDAG